MPRTPPARTYRPDTLAKALHDATARHGTSGYEIPLTALATATSLLGIPGPLRQASLHAMAHNGTAVADTTTILGGITDHFGYLTGRLDALTGWMANAGDHRKAALAGCYDVLASADLDATVKAAGGELLGPVYLELRGQHSRQAAGAFFTPPSLSNLIGALMEVSEGERVLEPCCGAGSMVLGAIDAMYARGLDPNACAWVLGDIDPLAVALAGINLAARGIENVILTVGDGMALGTGLPGDPLTHTQAAGHDRAA